VSGSHEPPRLPPALGPDAHKGEAGRLWCLCGSASYPGAAILVARAAQRAGAGLVTLIGVDPGLAAIVAPAAPEAIHQDLSDDPQGLLARIRESLTASRAHALLLGPGLGAGERTRGLLGAALDHAPPGRPILLDADGLNALGSELSSLRRARGPLVLTPHPGEAARLLGLEALPGDAAGRLEAAREIARRSGAVCCLKGRGTVVSDGERSSVEAGGNPGLATAGTGDVLAGILGAYLCRLEEGVYDAFEAARAAVAVHARSGDLAAAELGERALVASDLLRFLPAAQRELEGPRAGGV
jgi:hydroxyethylthiazole kinase-like uncharacterized protein yjeF